MSDLISRQAAIDAIMSEPPEPHYSSWYAYIIRDLPSVQLEPCKDTERMKLVQESAKTLINSAGKSIKAKALRNAGRFIQNAINGEAPDFEEIPPEPQWIPCSERLPNNADEVLTTYIVNGNKNKRFVETATYYSGDDGYWSSPWDEYRVLGTKVEVIAWMPLPTPYQPKEEAE